MLQPTSKKFILEMIKQLGLALIGVFLLALIISYGKAPLFYFMERTEANHFSERQRTFVQDRTQSGISLIEVTKKTVSNPAVQKLFGKYPYNRDFYGYIVRFLNRAKPKHVILDLSFELGSDLENPEKDRLLAHSINAASHPVSSALLLNNNPLSPSTQKFLQQQEKSIDLQTLSSDEQEQWVIGSNINLPFEELQKSNVRLYPATSLVRDQSETIRRISPIVRVEDKEANQVTYLPALSLAPLLDASNTIEFSETQYLKTDSHTVQLHGQALPIIKWYGNIKKGYFDSSLDQQRPLYPKIDAWDIIKSELLLECVPSFRDSLCQRFKSVLKAYPSEAQTALQPHVFNQQIAFIGVKLENNDIHPSIYRVDYPGIYIQVNALDNFLHDDFVRVVEPPITSIICLFILIFTIALGIRTRVSVGLPILIGLGIFYHYLTFFAYTEWGLWLNWTWPTLTLILSSVVIYTQRYISGENKRQQLRYAFAKYVSPGTLQSIEKSPEKQSLQGGQRRELTYMFCDIRGFTRFSENHEPEYVQHILTQYFRIMNTLILQTYQGSINKLLGDAIMAYWGFPLLKQDQTFLAVSAAIAMKEAMKHWKADSGKPPISIGIGINTGSALIGNVGSEDFMDFTVIGDAVNIASRLEQLNKQYKTTIIISAITYEKIKDRIHCKSLGTIQIRGKEKETQIYEALQFKDKTQNEKMKRRVEKLYASASQSSSAEWDTTEYIDQPNDPDDRRK